METFDTYEKASALIGTEVKSAHTGKPFVIRKINYAYDPEFFAVFGENEEKDWAFIRFDACASD